MITLEEIVEINKAVGGTTLNDGSIAFALHMAEKKAIYMKIALLLRAILIDHPFTDGNKRTALYTTYLLLERNDTPIDKATRIRIDKALMRIVIKQEDHSLVNIERRIRYAVEGR